MTHQIVESFPAYDVIKPTNMIEICEIEQEIPIFKADDTIAINYESRHHGMLRHMFRFGSVVSYAAQYGECPINAVEDTKRRAIESPHAGHKLHWLNACSVMISSDKRAKKTHFAASFGDIVHFEGRSFRIDKASNRNANLTEVFPAETSSGNYEWVAK